MHTPTPVYDTNDPLELADFPPSTPPLVEGTPRALFRQVVAEAIAGSTCLRDLRRLRTTIRAAANAGMILVEDRDLLLWACSFVRVTCPLRYGPPA